MMHTHTYSLGTSNDEGDVVVGRMRVNTWMGCIRGVVFRPTVFFRSCKPFNLQSCVPVGHRNQQPMRLRAHTTTRTT